MKKPLQQQAASLIRDASTPASELRQLLNQIETSLGKIRISSIDELKNIPSLFDQTANLLDTLEENGANIASEYARFDTVCAEYRKNAVQFIKALGGRSVYVQLREINTPEKERWWWFLDEYLDEQLRIQQRKTIRSFLITVGVLGTIILIYALFLAPDKETREFLNYQNNAEKALSEQALESAIDYAELALAIRPEDERILILSGIAAQLSGKMDLAEERFDKAQEVINDQVEFLSLRAQIFLAAGLPEYALHDSEQAIDINPESAIAHYHKGLAANALGDTQTAFLSLESAANFAHQEGKIELEGMARIQMAYLSQNIGSPQPTRTPGE